MVLWSMGKASIVIAHGEPERMENTGLFMDICSESQKIIII